MVDNNLNGWVVCSLGATAEGVGCVPLSNVPELPYLAFTESLRAMLVNSDGSFSESNRCVAYFAVQQGFSKDAATAENDNKAGLVFYALVARDEQRDVVVASHVLDYYHEGFLAALSAEIPAMNVFEREIAELHGVQFKGQPWDKPLRYPYNRHHRVDTIDTYPFYSIENRDELHEVQVGPVHAGIIEPGAFRFLCDGESIVHLEIALGYQHRGVESLLSLTTNRLRQMVLGESIAGDTAIGHAVAMAGILESGVKNWDGCDVIRCERAVALEMERLAMHIADTAALCADMAYQTGQVACEALRTMVINAMQQWCGNRFGKGLVRPFGANYRMTIERAKYIEEVIIEVVKRYRVVGRDLLSTPSVLIRLEGVCTVTKGQALSVGAVGPAARMTGIKRDARCGYNFYELSGFEPVVVDEQQEGVNGDLMARLKMRLREADVSCEMIMLGCKKLTGRWFEEYPAPNYERKMAKMSLVFSLVEGWRGEICHVVLTGLRGEVETYKIVDPSVHNWMMLALSVRGAQISDFPLSNKSFNLSYCGHDL